MDFSSSSSWAAISLVVLAVFATVAAVLLLRQRERIVRQAAELAGDVEALNDRLWALADSEEHYRSLIEAQGDLIVRRDGGRIVYANGAYAALTGLDEADIIGSDAQPRLVASRPAQALEGGARVFDECLATPEGERWISWVETVVPVALGQSAAARRARHHRPDRSRAGAGRGPRPGRKRQRGEVALPRHRQP